MMGKPPLGARDVWLVIGTSAALLWITLGLYGAMWWAASHLWERAAAWFAGA